MTITENVPLSTLTTFRIGGPAHVRAECRTEADIKAALLLSQERGLPWYVLGEGSNVLAADGSIGKVIIRLAADEISFEGDGEDVEVIADAGVSWDTLVHACARKDLWGVENLAGIPGTVGAAPVQNIGAYGTELSDTLRWVEAYDETAGKTVRLNADECGLAYRESRFKREPHLIIMRIGLMLSRLPNVQASYADLAKMKDAGVPMGTPALVGNAVRAIRNRKFPDLATCGTAGSFFKNPIVSHEAFEALRAQYPEVPGFSAPGGMKIPLAWILDSVLNLRGYRLGAARLYENQPLVLVTDIGASAQDVDALAADVAKRVMDTTGIVIEREVRSLA